MKKSIYFLTLFLLLFVATSQANTQNDNSVVTSVSVSTPDLVEYTYTITIYNKSTGQMITCRRSGSTPQAAFNKVQDYLYQTYGVCIAQQ